VTFMGSWGKNSLPKRAKMARSHLTEFIAKIPGFLKLMKVICRLSIRRRLIIFFLILSTIPITFIGYLSYNSSKNAIINKIVTYSQESLIQASMNLQLSLKKYQELSLELIINSNRNNAVVSFINTGANTDTLKELLKTAAGVDENVRSIFIGSLKDDSCVGAGFEDPRTNRLFLKLKQTKAFREAIKEKGQIYWGIYENDVVMVRIINNFSTGEPIGVYGVVFFGYQLTKKMSPSRYDNSNAISVKGLPYTIIVKLNGEILTSPDADDVGLRINQLLHNQNIKEILKQNKSSKGVFNDKVHDDNVLVTYHQVKDMNWYLLDISSNSYLYKETNAVGWFTFILAVVISFIAIIVSLLVSLSISIPLDQMKNVMKNAENGNLAVKVKMNTQDELAELGNSFNRMLEKIGGLIVETKTAIAEILNQSTALEDSSNQSQKTAESIAVAMDQISHGTMEQTRETEKSAQQMTDLSIQIENVVAEAGEVERITGNAKDLSFRSKVAVEQLIQRTNDTDKITSDIIKDINELQTSAVAIRNITEVISNIAEQTNLLALNANIEAARAGEMGRGFAVVAEEVNTLAAQSRNAAKTINEILKTIEAKTAISSKTAEAAYLILADQKMAVHTTREAFEQIIASMSEVVDRINKVNSLINNINNFKDVTVRAITNISSISQETAASAQEVLAASEEQTASSGQLKILAEELRQMAKQLVTDVAKFQVD
jgi:methyl-accepting chemotaxis protein